ncbi:hypothetical protein [Aneurinibacillus migulanus]|uniref:hypothetical protein n=1 Tax=Aneurinibacillus migulanus TaxID=47500 RepID=UPI000FAF5C7E|nr:hypothetical protein [Aneurinibacillus migulanus]MCP1358126.1 hypothetical protein [Aneurinibacillus migulanus]
MWQTLPISKELYGFLPESNWHEAWTATAMIVETEHKLEIHADIHVYYVKNKEEFELLLEAIRHLAGIKKEEMAKESCMIHFRCKGISTFTLDDSMPVQYHSGGDILVDTEFSEELAS